MLRERREDDESRDRLDLLEKHWRGTANLLLKQVRRIWIGVTVCALALLFLCVYTYVSLH